MGHNINEVELDIISFEIPNILFSKLKANNVHSIGTLRKLDENKFKKIHGVGVKVLSEFRKLKEYIDENQSEIYDLKRRNGNIEFPINQDIKNINIISIFQNIVFDFLEIFFSKKRLKEMLWVSYGMVGKEIKGRDQVAKEFDISTERVRQRLEELRNMFYILLSGTVLEKQKCYCNKKSLEPINKFREVLLKNDIHSSKTVNDIITKDFNIELNKNNEAILAFLLNSFKIEKSKKFETYFTSTNFYFVKSELRKQFVDISKQILLLLRIEVEPLKKTDIVEIINKQFRNIDYNLIIRSLEILPEIEPIFIENIEHYQMRFEKLTNSRDRAYRILLETGEAMYIDNIANEINYRLKEFEGRKIYNRHSLSLAGDQRFVPRFKTGYWYLRSWGAINEKLEDLVRNSILILGKPSTFSDITEVALDRWPKAKKSSIKTFIGKLCDKTTTGLYVLHEWKDKYTDFEYHPKIKRVVSQEPEKKIKLRKAVIHELTKANDNAMLASSVIKDVLDSYPKFKRTAFYKIFNDKKYFQKTYKGKKLIVSLVN